MEKKKTKKVRYQGPTKKELEAELEQIESRYREATQVFAEVTTCLENAAKYSWDESPKNLKDAAGILRFHLDRILTPNRCGDELKSMYYCDLKSGHKGQHCAYWGAKWD